MSTAESTTSSVIQKLKCCILTKQSDSTFTQCERFAFKPLTKELIEIVTKKNLPLYYDDSTRHRFVICLCHRRMILNVSKFNDYYQKFNLSNYEVGEQRELNEFLEEFLTYCRESQEYDVNSNTKSTKVSLERYENLWKRYRLFEKEYDPVAFTAKEAERKECDQIDADEDLKIPFAALSAMTLRRCKKFFKLPNRSGANSKLLLLEGIHEHVESISVNQAETAAFFMYTIRNKKNRLDYPNDL